MADDGTFQYQVISEEGCGFARLPFKVESQELLRCFRSIVVTQESNTNHHERENEPGIGTRITSVVYRNIRGRDHYEFDASSPSLLACAPYQRLLRCVSPYCEAYFTQTRRKGGESKTSSYKVSTVQLVEAMPGAPPQSWHADNAAGGLTFVFALCDQSAELAGTQFLTHSHLLLRPSSSSSSSPRLLGRVNLSLKSSIATPTLLSGEGLVFDANLLHRGLPNNSRQGLSRPILVIRYDDVKNSAPGMTRFGTMWRNWAGSASFHLLNAFIRIRSD